MSGIWWEWRRECGRRGALGGRGYFGKGNRGGSWGRGSGAAYPAEPRNEDVMDYTQAIRRDDLDRKR